MPGKKPPLTPLTARKELLLLESQLNRVRLLEAIHDWKAELHRSKEQLANLGSMAVKTAKAAAAVSAVAGLFSNRGGTPKQSWLSIALKGMATGTSLWYWFKSRKSETEE